MINLIPNIFTSSVHFQACIPAYLQPTTQSTLRLKMRKNPSSSDKPGHIYAIEIKGNPHPSFLSVRLLNSLSADPKAPGKLRIKVGREATFDTRVQYWTQHFGGSEAVRHFLPGRDRNINHHASLIGGRDAKTPYYKLLESLILAELEDLVQHKAYLKPDFRSLKEPPTPKAKGPMCTCIMPNCASLCWFLKYLRWSENFRWDLPQGDIHIWPDRGEWHRQHCMRGHRTLEHVLR